MSDNPYCAGPLIVDLATRTPLYWGERSYDDLPFCSDEEKVKVAKIKVAPASPVTGRVTRVNEEKQSNSGIDPAETARLRLPAIVHGQAPCPCKPVNAKRSDHIKTHSFIETIDPKLPRATIHSIGKHIFPPRERPCWTSETRSSYPPRFTRPPPIAPRPPLGKIMHEDRKWIDYLSESRKEYGVKETDSAPVGYVDQARHTFQFKEDLRNVDFESTHKAAYAPRYVLPDRAESKKSESHVPFGDQRYVEMLSEAQKAFVEHPPANTQPIVNDQSKHTYNFKPEPRLCDPIHTSYDEAFAPRPDFRPDKADGADFYSTHFKLGDLQKENDKLSMYQKEFRQHEPSAAKGVKKDLYRTNFKLFGSKDDWMSTYNGAFAKRVGQRPALPEGYPQGVYFSLRDPKSRAEQTTTTNMADFVDHGMEKPQQEHGDLTRTTMVMTDPRLKEITDYHKKSTYGEAFAPRLNTEPTLPIKSEWNSFDNIMGRDKSTEDFNSTYRTDMIDHGVTPPEEKINKDYVENVMNPFVGVLSRGKHVKMAGNTGQYNTEHRDNYNPKPESTAISPEEMAEMKTRLRKSHFLTWHKFREYLSEYQTRYNEYANFPEKPQKCGCKCDCICKCAGSCGCSGSLEPVKPYREIRGEASLSC